MLIKLGCLLKLDDIWSKDWLTGLNNASQSKQIAHQISPQGKSVNELWNLERRDRDVQLNSIEMVFNIMGFLGDRI